MFLASLRKIGVRSLTNAGLINSSCVFKLASRFSAQLNHTANTGRYVSLRTLTTKPSVGATSSKSPSTIQSLLSPLQATSRRQTRKKRDVEQLCDQETFSVTAYSTCEEINLESLKQSLEKKGLYNVREIPKDIADAIYLRANYKVTDEPREIIVFREGSATFWNVPPVERSEFLRFALNHQQDTYDYELVYSELEDMVYKYSDGETKLDNDAIILSRDCTPEELLLLKYTFSNALSLSVKLNIWEASLDRYIDSIEAVTEDLKLGKVNRINRSEALKKTGELFTWRHLINLSSDLLDTPDFYWNRQELESLYAKMCSDLKINKRTKVMNEKINCCCELMSLIRNDLNDQHHTRLEWMIIVLILVEVIFEVVHHIEREQLRGAIPVSAERQP